MFSMSTRKGFRSGVFPGSVLTHTMDKLDSRFIPHPGRITLLEGGRDAVDALFQMFCVQKLSERGQVYWVDGATSFDPHEIARMLSRGGCNPRIFLDRIHVSRAFTAHQMCAILEEGLEGAMNKNGPGPIMVPWISSLFSDEGLEANEAQHLIRGSLEHLREMSRKQDATIVLSAAMGKEQGSKRIRRSVREYSDWVLNITVEDCILFLQNPDGDVLSFPLIPGQTSFESFPGG